MEASPPAPFTAPSREGRVRVLDGWRAVSILLVLAGHMLPLGPKGWELNGSIAASGMAIFFTLSGFLITNVLLRNPDVPAFLVRRLARIVPLAWLVLAMVFAFDGADVREWCANLFFHANLPPFYLEHTGHFWSLCVEVQFYVFIALAVWAFGRRGLFIIPIAALAVTALRIATGTEISIVTWFRVDEILAGGTMALLFHESRDGRFDRCLAAVPFVPAALLFLLSAHPRLGGLNYARPYLSALMVAITLNRPIRGLSSVLSSRLALYMAKISYAVYIIHPYSTAGWLGAGEGIEKYLKRPLCFAITFALAHLSTFHFERPINDWAHRFGSRRADRP